MGTQNCLYHKNKSGVCQHPISRKPSNLQQRQVVAEDCPNHLEI